MVRYAISDGRVALGQAGSFGPMRQALLEHAAFAASRGCDFFLLRERSLGAGELAALSRDLLAVFGGGTTCLLVHSRADVAIATGAGGVHLPSGPGELTPGQVREAYRLAGQPAPVVSLSCHTGADVDRARRLEPDLILFGPIFGKQVEGRAVHAGVGLGPLRDACSSAGRISVLALGGVTESQITACLEAGAAGVAGIRLFRPEREPGNDLKQD